MPDEAKALRSTLSVPRHLQRGAHEDDETWFASASYLIELLARTQDLEDLASTSLLDVGCGTKFTKAFLELGIPIERYVGIDVYDEVITFLRREVTDPRFEYHHLPARNELYNPDGIPLDSFSRLPCGNERFDLISLFSVFTHLAPHDYRPMLRLLRQHARPGTGLVFSIFVHSEREQSLEELDAELELLRTDHEVTEATLQDGDDERHLADLRLLSIILLGRVPIDDEAEARRRLTKFADECPGRSGELLRTVMASLPEDVHYLEGVPDRPLLQSSYSRRLAFRLIEGTGWRVEVFHPPERHLGNLVVQHYFVCRAI